MADLSAISVLQCRDGIDDTKKCSAPELPPIKLRNLVLILSTPPSSLDIEISEPCFISLLKSSSDIVKPESLLSGLSLLCLLMFENEG